MVTIDLHDLAAILLFEYSLLEDRFKHARLREINDRSKPRSALPSHIVLPELDSLPYATPVNAYFLDETSDENAPLIELQSFMHPEFTNNTSTPGPLSDAELEMIYWRCKHHDRGYTLAHAMQLVLDNLPSPAKVRMRTSQGHNITIPATAFVIAEVPILSHSTTYICKITNMPHLGPTNVNLAQYLTGSDGSFQWVYIVFGNEEVGNIDLDKDGRVALDLVAPMLGMRGLGGEIFAMERLEDYHSKLLPFAADECGELVLSSRIVPGSSGRQVEDSRAIELSKRVLTRLGKVMHGEDGHCSYCGKRSSQSQCSGCRKVKYCDKGCQSKAWKYHKRWCKIDAQAK
jgi:hypothetical protein